MKRQKGEEDYDYIARLLVARLLERLAELTKRGAITLTETELEALRVVLKCACNWVDEYDSQAASEGRFDEGKTVQQIIERAAKEIL